MKYFLQKGLSASDSNLFSTKRHNMKCKQLGKENTTYTCAEKHNTVLITGV